MLNTAVSFVIGLVIFGLLYWVIGELPLPAAIEHIAAVVLVVLFVLWLLDWLVGLTGAARPWRSWNRPPGQ